MYTDLSIKFSVIRLGSESLNPEQETVVLRQQEFFLQLCLWAAANRCVTLVFHTLLSVLTSETAAEHTDRTACMYKRF